MKTDETLDPNWVREQQSRFVGWEIFQRALDGKADEPMSDKEFKDVLRRCGLSEADYRAMIQETRKRMRAGCPDGLRMMSDTNDYPSSL